MDSPRSSGGSSTSTKLLNRFRKDKRNVSYRDLPSEVKNDVTKTPSSIICRKKDCTSEGFQKDELVKYMSKLPSFLEKGERDKAKALNLGVLEWNKLENWRNFQSPRPSSRYSTSSSTTASSFWTEGSSSHYGRGDATCSSSGHRGSLRSYLNITPIEGHYKDVESHNVAKYTDIKANPTNSDRKKNILREPVFPAKSSELKLRKCRKESSDLQNTRSSTDFQNQGEPSSKGKLRVQADAYKQKSEKLQNQYDNTTRETNGSEVPHKEPVSRSTSKIWVEKSSTMPIDPNLYNSLKIPNMKSTISDSEVQNLSPSCRLSSVLNRIRRKSHLSRDSSGVLQPGSEDITARSGSKIADSFVRPNNETNDQSNAASRDHFSPLKRLLIPLLKTKVGSPKFSEHSPRNSTTTRRFSTSINERRGLSDVHPPRVKLDFSNLRNPGCDVSRRDTLQGPSTLQAYFQVSAKNDLPLFTFAVDNNSDALAATLRKSSLRRNDPTWIYTFFSVHEMRRKSGGWLTQGSKVKDYVPNVVAQMKVSELPLSRLGEHVSVDQLKTREFVLYAVDVRGTDHQICDTQPNHELAAIVVKFPRKMITELNGSSQKVKVPSNSGDLQEDKFIFGNQELFSTTVLLPGAIHGLPSKGEPSPLIERWLSGGQCDCGGWDLGCKVKVLGNNNHNPNSHFELFSQYQEKSEQATPFFMLSSLKNGVFSVKFNSTLSLLQAFSICVAVFDSMKPSELQQPYNFSEEKLAEEATMPEDCGLSTPKLVEFSLPARFASQPPHTPVERV
ncbi:hypothetical protein ACET3Z_005917 [Daucus carota]